MIRLPPSPFTLTNYNTGQASISHHLHNSYRYEYAEGGWKTESIIWDFILQQCKQLSAGRKQQNTIILPSSTTMSWAFAWGGGEVLVHSYSRGWTNRPSTI